MIIFISGHLDLTEEEFKNHYIPLIDAHKNDSFIVGDAKGCDSMAQIYLKSIGAKCVVYHMFSSPRNNAGFECIGGFQFDEARDKAMTENSDMDIAWVRKGREKSGTAKNIKRRKRKGLRSGLKMPLKSGF